MSFLMRHVADAVLSGILLGKLTRARELGVALEIDEQSSLSLPTDGHWAGGHDERCGQLIR